MQLLRQSDSNSRPDVRHVAGVPDHRASKKQTNEGLNNVRTVTSSLHSNEGITPWTRLKYEAKMVDLPHVTETPNRSGLSPGVTESTV